MDVVSGINHLKLEPHYSSVDICGFTVSKQQRLLILHSEKDQ